MTLSPFKGGHVGQTLVGILGHIMKLWLVVDLIPSLTGGWSTVGGSLKGCLIMIGLSASSFLRGKRVKAATCAIVVNGKNLGTDF